MVGWNKCKLRWDKLWGSCNKKRNSWCKRIIRLVSCRERLIMLWGGRVIVVMRVTTRTIISTIFIHNLQIHKNSNNNNDNTTTNNNINNNTPFTNKNTNNYTTTSNNSNNDMSKRYGTIIIWRRNTTLWKTKYSILSTCRIVVMLISIMYQGHWLTSRLVIRLTTMVIIVML